MNEPIKRNIKGSANGAKTSFAGATFKITHKDAPSSAVTGIGKLSQIHKTMIAEIIAARLCASGFKPSGAKNIIRKTIGARKNPA